ncbi:hypothetical protein T265_02130 [Opisthorchis viverrini]|uniref:Uncharacterized protein n=1 Tax=Opisthorchis viverrini TaxID=6198 RepID=A0A074ZWX8_OPIVI|nr:hypothetical protein T265_02130 [Opisthorchis viverrini]KER31616.1 hypothetical protein T265_02130 [Opisthorchis viverrini]
MASAARLILAFINKMGYPTDSLRINLFVDEIFQMLLTKFRIFCRRCLAANICRPQPAEKQLDAKFFSGVVEGLVPEKMQSATVYKSQTVGLVCRLLELEGVVAITFSETFGPPEKSTICTTVTSLGEATQAVLLPQESG